MKEQDIYDLMHSLMMYNHFRYSLHKGNECCHCGKPREGGSVFCEKCNRFWHETNEKTDWCLTNLYHKLDNKKKRDYDFEGFLKEFRGDFEKLMTYVGDTAIIRKTPKIDIHEIDSLVKDISERWNITLRSRR